MPWQECSKMDERLKFVARLLEGEKMAVLCREFDISRKTGYKIFSRYKDCGLEGLTDRSRRPFRQGCRLPFQIETLVLQLKRGSIRPAYFEDKYEVDVRERFAEQWDSLRAEGYLAAADPDQVALSREGLLRVDSLLHRFFLPEHAGVRYT